MYFSSYFCFIFRFFLYYYLSFLVVAFIAMCCCHITWKLNEIYFNIKEKRTKRISTLLKTEIICCWLDDYVMSICITIYQIYARSYTYHLCKKYYAYIYILYRVHYVVTFKCIKWRRCTKNGPSLTAHSAPESKWNFYFLHGRSWEKLVWYDELLENIQRIMGIRNDRLLWFSFWIYCLWVFGDSVQI